MPFILGPEGFVKLPNVKRLLDEINARPAAARAEALKDKHGYKTDVDAETMAAMFPHRAAKAAGI